MREKAGGRIVFLEKKNGTFREDLQVKIFIGFLHVNPEENIPIGGIGLSERNFFENNIVRIVWTRTGQIFTVGKDRIIPVNKESVCSD